MQPRRHSNRPSNFPFLAQVFGNRSFRPQQEAVTAAAIAGKDVLVLMPTGGAAAHSLQEMHSQRQLLLPAPVLATSQVAAPARGGDEGRFPLRSGWPVRGRREVAVLPAAGGDGGGSDRGRVAPHLSDAGPGGPPPRRRPPPGLVPATPLVQMARRSCTLRLLRCAAHTAPVGSKMGCNGGQERAAEGDGQGAGRRCRRFVHCPREACQPHTFAAPRQPRKPSWCTGSSTGTCPASSSFT